MSRLRHIPFRMCIGCGRRRKKEEMMRFVRDASGSILISTENVQGRGFYLCFDLTCLNTARKKMRRSGFLKMADLERLSSWITREKEKQEAEE